MSKSRKHCCKVPVPPNTTRATLSVESLETRELPAPPLTSASVSALQPVQYDELLHIDPGQVSQVPASDQQQAFGNSLTDVPSQDRHEMNETVSFGRMLLNIASSQASPIVVSHDKPSIVNFGAIEEGPQTWTFRGCVQGDNVAGLTVQFGGLPSLTGKTAIVDNDGWFHLTVQLQSGEYGTATAQTTDSWGQVSNLARTHVRPTN